MKKKVLGLSTLALAGVVALTGCSKGMTEEEALKYAQEQGYVKSDGYVKAEDYNIDIDADVTTGSSVTAVNPAKELTNAQKLELIKDYLRGAVLYYTDGEGNEYAPAVDYTKTPFARIPGKAYTVEYTHTAYKANANCTVGTTNYTKYQTITIQEYNAMSDTDKAKFSKKATPTYGELVDVKTLNLTPHYSYREMYPLATSYNNMPGIATAEFWIDVETMKLYSFSENNTEKTLYIPQNPNVELYFTKQVEEEHYVGDMRGGTDYWRSYGVQIKGTARILDSKGADATLFNSIVPRYAKTMYGYDQWTMKEVDGSALAMPAIYSNMTCIEITPDEYVINSLWGQSVTEANKANWKMANADKIDLDVYDKWAEIIVGKDVRQTYKVTYND